METSALVVGADDVSLPQARGGPGRLPLSSVRRLILVRFGAGLLHGEEPFLVVDGGPWLLVAPFLSGGAAAMLAALRRHAPPLLEAEADMLPWRWRRRLGGWLPLFPLPALAWQPASSLPRWPLRGPRPYDDLAAVAPEWTDGH